MVKKEFLIFIIFLFLLNNYCYGSSIYRNGTIIIENSRVRKTLLTSGKNPAPIRVASYVDKQNSRELIHSKSNLPWFEFVVNKQKVTSNDPHWVFETISEKELRNGGNHIELHFRATSGPVEGLQIVLHNILYPESTLIREKIELRSPDGIEFSLNKHEGRLWFKFPQYAIAAGKNLTSTEIRIATWGKEAIDFDEHATYDDRKFDGGAFFNLAQNHMFHPDIIAYNWEDLSDSHSRTLMMKGPFSILEQPDFTWLSVYEHASQDSREGLEASLMPATTSALSVDALQGVDGFFQTEEKDRDFWFLGIRHQLAEQAVDVSVEILRGGYLEGEKITSQKPYSSVWTASAFTGSGEPILPLIHHYLLHQITEFPASRVPEYYYNTWGMQRDIGSASKSIWEVFTEERILEEIERAAKLNVEIFVLDDGWNQMQGVWKPHRERLPNGLAPLREAIEAHGMKMGIWLSPMGIAREADRFNNNPQWVITDDNDEPIRAQWGHPAFDFVSDFKDTLVADSKWLIDQGARFFKWDAINTFNSSLAGLHHGDESHTKEERRARYDYLLPIYVTEAMLELLEYDDEVVIEIDLTEARRAVPGLITLQAGKFFWMNNGASGYGDYSSYRAKSMRAIPSNFNGIIPLDLFTYANYPHNVWPFFAQRYNVNSSLIAGHGFWGNLERLSDEQLERAGSLVSKSRRVLPFLKDVPMEISGPVGSAPEIYSRVNFGSGAGQVVAFSAKPLHHLQKIPMQSDQVLALVNHSYRIENDTIYLPFTFTMVDDTREAFIIPNQGSGIHISSSTAWIDDIQWNDGQLTLMPGSEGIVKVEWEKRNGTPKITGLTDGFRITRNDKVYSIELKVKPQDRVIINKL
jgi:hypothetical protein